jgi:hypothetical protein
MDHHFTRTVPFTKYFGLVVGAVLPIEYVLHSDLILKTDYPDLSWFSYTVLLWYNARYEKHINNEFVAS